MLIEVDLKTYNSHFHSDSNPFISEKFLELNRYKTEEIVRLIDEGERPVIGLMAGISNGILKSPFSAPFGGLHFKNDNIYISEIDSFIKSLQAYISHKKLNGISITLPPNIYHENFNAKAINSFIRAGFQSSFPEITNWIDLFNFKGEFMQKNSREYYRQAVRNKLSFKLVVSDEEKLIAYKIISENRKKFGRPIYMTFDDILNTGKLWPVDFFIVSDSNALPVASAIFYRFHTSICYAVFWGDNEEGRPLRAMDFLASNLWNYYKSCGFRYIDLGISTEKGLPNEGLLRFKESHDATSSLRYTFYLKN